MRRILIYKETILPTSETFILAQMQALRRFDPVLVGLERTYPSIPLVRDPVLLSGGSPFRAKMRARLYRRTGVAPLFHRKMKRLAPSLIHAHFASGGRSALPLARALHIPLLVTLHGSDVTVRGSQRQLYRDLGTYASKFICVSNFIRDRALDAGFPEKKLYVHHIGIDRSMFSPSETANRLNSILFVGRLVEKKGCEYLVRAMQQVQKENLACDLEIIGDGPLRTSLEVMATELRVRARFRGSQPTAVVREALQTARIVCVPSVTAANGDSEGLPTVVAEAQAAGVPVVSTTHAGIPEIITNGVNGLLVPERDAGSLAAALLLLLHDDQRWRQFHQAALRKVEQHFDLKVQTAELEAIYGELISEDATIAAD